MIRLDGVLRRIGTMGVTGVERHWALIPPDLARRVGPEVARVGDGILTLMKRSDSLRMNRVVGLGHRGAAKEPMIDAIVARYRAAKVDRFKFLLEPGPQATEIERWLLKRGFRRHGGHALLLRDCRNQVPRLSKPLRVARAGPGQWSTMVAIQRETFGTPASRIGWSMADAADPAYEHYLAFVGASFAGVGSLRVAHGLAWLGGAATRPRWRRRGAQAAIIAARLRRAARLRCSWAWSETALPAPGRPQGSHRNLIRLGFEPVRVRPAFLWRSR